MTLEPEDEDFSHSSPPQKREKHLHPWTWVDSSKPLNKKYSRRVGKLKKILVISLFILFALLLFWPNLHFVEDPFLKDPSFIQGNSMPPGMKHMSKASLRSSTQKGNPYLIQSESATQLSQDDFSFQKPTATIFLKNGEKVILQSQKGEGHKKEKTVHLLENVTIQQSKGYELQTQKATFDLNSGDAHGEEPVKGQGPLGTIQSGGFQTQNQGSVIVFKDGVHLTFIPSSS